MYEVLKCAFCLKPVECGINPKDHVNHPFSILSIYKIDDYADACEDARETTRRNKRNVILCKKCDDFVRSLINIRLKRIIEEAQNESENYN